jgi:hypothetical protein
MKIRTRVVPVLCGIALAASAVSPTVAHAQVRPEPDDGRTSSAPSYAAQMAQLIEDGRHAPTLAVRKLIHNEMVLLRIDGRWDSA